MKTILVSGSNGFVGKHLVRELHENGNKVIGVGGPNIKKGPNDAYLAEYHVCDLTDGAQLAELDFTKVDAILHLASLASVKLSFDEPARFIGDNGAITINLFEALMKQNAKPRVIVVSSGAVYTPKQSMPIGEDGKIVNSSPYVVSKVLTENICDYYRSRGIESVIVRPFNHIGPGQGPGFLLPDLAAQIKEAAQGNKPLTVGNLTTKRDYTDVRDVAKAYRLLATADKLDDTLYNVCSGKSVAGEYFLEKLLELLAPGKKLNVEVDKSRFRPNDAPDIVGNSTHLQKAVDWQPNIPLDQTIADFVAGL